MSEPLAADRDGQPDHENDTAHSRERSERALGPDSLTVSNAVPGDVSRDPSHRAERRDATPTDPDRRGSTTPSPRRTTSLDEIRGIYAEQADTMDRFSVVNRLLTGRYRRRLFGRAEGRVLDVACGTGLNRRYLPEGTDYVGVDLSPAMLAKAADRYDDLAIGEELREMDAQDLAFPDGSFDTVISSLSTCTFPDPTAALREMARVCAPDGRVLLLEHGRSDVGIVARFQDWRADAHFEKHACRWNQAPLAVVSDAGLPVRDATTGMLGIVTAIEAAPA